MCGDGAHAYSHYGHHFQGVDSRSLFVLHCHTWYKYMGVSKNRGGPPKWMVFFLETPIFWWMIWGEKPHHFLLNTHIKLTSYGHGAPRCQAAYSKRLFADNLDRPWAEKTPLEGGNHPQEPGFWMILVGVHLFGEFKYIRTKQRNNMSWWAMCFFLFKDFSWNFDDWKETSLKLPVW